MAPTKMLQAVDYARWLIKQGKQPGLAITLAAKRFNVPVSEVAGQLAQRRRRQ